MISRVATQPSLALHKVNEKEKKHRRNASGRRVGRGIGSGDSSPTSEATGSPHGFDIRRLRSWRDWTSRPLRSRHSIVSSFTDVGGTKPARPPIKWTLGKQYLLPRRVVAHSLEVLDGLDLPDMPGILHKLTLSAVIRRFDNMFRNRQTERQASARESQIEDIFQKLEWHTQRRRGTSAVKQGLLEWEATSYVYELFCVELNIFERIFFVIDVSEGTSMLSKICSCFLVGLIILSISTWVISTLPGQQEIPANCTSEEKGDCVPEPKPAYQKIEMVCVYFFTLEYLIRVLTVHSVRFGLLDEDFLQGLLTGEGRGMKHWVWQMGSSAMGNLGASLAKSPGGIRQSLTSGTGSNTSTGAAVSGTAQDGKLMTVIKHVCRPANLVDLAAILPYWLEQITGNFSSGGAMIVLRLLRLSRVFRVFKLGKYNDVFTLFTRVMSQSVPALSLMVFFLVIGCVLFGTLMWFFEQGTWYPEGHPKLMQIDPPIPHRGAYLRPDGSRNPDGKEESPFPSILHAFWFVIVTITTVGYGDVVPRTEAGKLVGAATILNGIIVLAMPIGVVGANFSNEYYRVLDEKKRRARMKHRLDLMREMEAEQDALIEAQEQVADGWSEHVEMEAAEKQRVVIAQQGLVDFAQKVETSWEYLPDTFREELTFEFRCFMNRLLQKDSRQEVATMATTPVVQISRLHELDRLTNRVYDALLSASRLPRHCSFGIADAHKCRKDWTAFTDACWDYVVNVCHVKKTPDPPEFFELKAFLARCTALRARGGSAGGYRSERSERSTFAEFQSEVKDLEMSMSNLSRCASGSPQAPADIAGTVTANPAGKPEVLPGVVPENDLLPHEHEGWADAHQEDCQGQA